MRDLTKLMGIWVEDNGELSCVDNIIEELQTFVEQFSVHSMNEYGLVLQGKKQAYEDVIEYLKRVSPTNWEDLGDD